MTNHDNALVGRDDLVISDTTSDEARYEESGSAGAKPLAVQVGFGILLSRLTGLVRERVIAHYFGLSIYTDAFKAALRIPNVLQNLLGEGTLSASVIPIYAQLLEEEKKEDAGRFASATLGILMAVAGLLALIGMLVAPFLVPLLFPRWGPEVQELTVRILRVLFPMMGLLVLSAWALAILNSHRRFLLSYSAPVLWNVAMIATLFMLGGWLGWVEGDLVTALAWGALVGGALQLFVQLPTIFALTKTLRPRFSLDIFGVREAIRNFAPVVAARGAVNISGLFDLFLAGLLAQKAVSAMANAQMLYLLPISLFAMSVAASELPELSRARGRALEEIGRRLEKALEGLSFFMIPATLGYFALGDVVVGFLFQTGEFGPRETAVTAAVLAAYSLGLNATARSRVFSSAFYALRDTRTPARFAYVRIVLSLLVAVAVMFPLDRFGFEELRLGAVGLGLGASAGAWVEYFLLRRAIDRQIGAVRLKPFRTLRLLVAGCGAAGVGIFLKMRLAESSLPVLIEEPVTMGLVAGTLIPFGVVYLALSRALGIRLPLRLPGRSS